MRFVPDPLAQPSPLIPFITVRAVQRRPLKTRALTPEQKSALEASVAPGYRVVWFETLRERWRVARLMFRNAKLAIHYARGFRGSSPGD